jgi:hypothetical protein
VERIVRVLKQSEVDVPFVELIPKIGVSEQTFHLQRVKYVDLDVGKVRYVKHLQSENQLLSTW